jgi:hypothetical protein
MSQLLGGALDSSYSGRELQHNRVPAAPGLRKLLVMMWESGPWKLELYRLVLRCERQFNQLSRVPHKDWWEDAVQTMQMEKAVFLSAFIVRKLIDSNRLSMQVEESQTQVQIHPLLDPDVAPDSMNWEKIERFYDLDHAQVRSVPLRQLVNWLIHSFTFLIDVRSDHAGGLVPTGFWCNSDRTRRSRKTPGGGILPGELVRVGWTDYKELLRRAIHDDVLEISFHRDGHGGYVERRSAVHSGPTNIEDYV